MGPKEQRGKNSGGGAFISSVLIATPATSSPVLARLAYGAAAGTLALRTNSKPSLADEPRAIV